VLSLRGPTNYGQKQFEPQRWKSVIAKSLKDDLKSKRNQIVLWIPFFVLIAYSRSGSAHPEIGRIHVH
jgi:hypothetical protein